MPDSSWFAGLTEAQSEVFPEIFSRFPDLAYGAPVLLATTDGGKTYGFGTDLAGTAVYPMGHVEMYPNLAAIPNSPMSPGEDFMVEGSRIRIPNNRTRTFNGGPYARFVVSPDTPVSATQEPVLFPRHARMLLVYKALEQWASRPGSGAHPDYYEQRYSKLLNKLFLEFATQYNRSGRVFQGSSSLLYVGDLGQVGINT